MTKIDELPELVRTAVARLEEPRPMRRGSLGERFLKCGKPRCACAADEKARHGPYFSLTRVVHGQTRSRRVPADQVERMRRQIEAGHEFRQQVDEYWEACEEWADTELALGAVTAVEDAEKRGSRRRSRRQLKKKSRDSSTPRSRPS
jgi:hypothetical protein